MTVSLLSMRKETLAHFPNFSSNKINFSRHFSSISNWKGQNYSVTNVKLLSTSPNAATNGVANNYSSAWFVWCSVVTKWSKCFNSSWREVAPTFHSKPRSSAWVVDQIHNYNGCRRMRHASAMHFTILLQTFVGYSFEKTRKRRVQERHRNTSMMMSRNPSTNFSFQINHHNHS